VVPTPPDRKCCIGGQFWYKWFRFPPNRKCCNSLTIYETQLILILNIIDHSLGCINKHVYFLHNLIYIFDHNLRCIFDYSNISLGQISSSPTSFLVTLQPGLFLFAQKTSLKTVSRSVQVRDFLPFGSPLGPLLATLDHSSPMSIYMICSCRQKTCFQREIFIPRVFTLNSLRWFLISLTTLPSNSMISAKTPLFGPTTKMTPTLLKVTITGYSP
jgi:hypothetical protein